MDTWEGLKPGRARMGKRLLLVTQQTNKSYTYIDRVWFTPPDEEKFEILGS